VNATNWAAFCKSLAHADAVVRESVSVCRQSAAVRIEAANVRREAGERIAASIAIRNQMARPATDDSRSSRAADLEDLQRTISDLRQALSTRDTIWTAKTIIAATTRCSPEEAHRLLVLQSQHENRKLREIAEEIVARHMAAA
jgi:AmiR/NasT family two-component response regulator